MIILSASVIQYNAIEKPHTQKSSISKYFSLAKCLILENLPFIANMNDGEDNEESERDGQDEQETGGDELSEWVRADIVQHPD